MEQDSQVIDNALSPVKVVALRSLLVAQALVQAEKAVKARDSEYKGLTPLQKEIAEDSALLKLSKMGIYALTTEQLAQFIGIKPEVFAEETRRHQTPLDRALLLDRLNFMIRVDAAGILENRAKDKKAEQVPEDQASPLSLLLPEATAERGAALEEAKKLIHPYMSPPANNRQRVETAATDLRTDRFYDEELQSAYNSLRDDNPSLLTDKSLQELQALDIKIRKEALSRQLSGASREQLQPYDELLHALGIYIKEKEEATRKAHRDQLEQSAQAAAQNTAELLNILKQARAGTGSSDNGTTTGPAAESAGQAKTAKQPTYDFEATWREVPDEAPDNNENKEAPAQETPSDTSSTATQTNEAAGEDPQADAPKRPFNTDNLLQFSAVPDDRLNDMPLEQLRDLYSGVLVEQANRGTTADLQGHYDQLIQRVGKVIEQKQKTSTPKPRN